MPRSRPPDPRDLSLDGQPSGSFDCSGLHVRGYPFPTDCTNPAHPAAQNSQADLIAWDSPKPGGAMKALNLLLVLVATVVVILLVARLPPPLPEISEPEIARIEAEVLGVVEGRFEALRNLDMDGVLQSAHPDLLAWAAGGRILNSAEYRDGLYQWANGKESWKGHWIERNVRVLTPDLAVFWGSYVDTIQYSDGRVLHCPRCSAVFLFERTPDGWRYSMGAGSSTPAEPVEAG